MFRLRPVPAAAAGAFVVGAELVGAAAVGAAVVTTAVEGVESAGATVSTCD